MVTNCSQGENFVKGGWKCSNTYTCYQALNDTLLPLADMKKLKGQNYI